MKIAIRIGSLAIGLLLGPVHAEGQDRMLFGRVLDAASGEPLRDVHVRVEGRDAGAVTDTSGRFGTPWNTRAPLVLHFSRVGHAAVTHTLRPMDRVDGQELVIRMERGRVDIPEVVISRDRTPEVVFQRKDLHVGDHLPTVDGLWVLVYEKPRLWHSQAEAGQQVLRHARLHLLDTLFREVGSWPLPGPVRRLHRDHQGRAIVEGLDEAWLIEMGKEGPRLHCMERGFLQQAVLPWTDSIPGTLLGNTRTSEFPAFAHIAWDGRSEHQQVFCSVEDRHVMQLFRSQYKYMSGRDKVIAMDLEIATGVDREIIAGFMTGFPDDILFRVPYAPLFVVDDTLCVFDHSMGTIRRFGPDLTPCGEVPMVHHRVRAYRERLLHDTVNGSVYALFACGPLSWLREVDARSGQLGEELRLIHPFPEELKVHDGHVYYVYRPFSSLQHRTLYREKLPEGQGMSMIAAQP